MNNSVFKKLIATVFVSLIAALCLGCGTKITYVYSATETDYYMQYVVEIPRTEIAAIEATATDACRDPGDNWTVTKYVERLALLIGGDSEKNDSADSVTYRISRSVKRADEDDDSEDDSPEPSIKRGFLFNTYTYEIDSPFAGAGSDLTGATTPAAGSFTGIIKNGVTDDSAVKVFPALGEAFTGIDYSDIAGIKADFIWNNKRIRPVNGENVYLGRNRVALWESTLGDAGKLVYEYSAPNSVGWYILIAAIGCVTVTVIMLVTRKSDAKPKMVKMQSGRRVYPRVGGYYTGDYRGRVNNDRSARGDNIRVIDPFDDELPPDDETPDQARKDLDDIFFGDR